MKCQKELFSLPKNIHYLNCANKAPLLKSAEKACMDALLKERNPSLIKDKDFFEDAEKVRKYFSELVNSQANQIAIIPSASYGLATALRNVKPKIGGNAVTIKDEFPSGYLQAKKWCNTNNNELIVVESDKENIGQSWNENVLDNITEKTSVVLMSSVHWMNGIKFNLEAIGKRCEEVNAILIVDGSQSVGAMPMDVEKYRIHALVCAGYKWLFGTYSLSIAYFGSHFDQGTPIEEAWLNREKSEDFKDLANYKEKYKPQANRYNVGEFSNLILMPVFRESIKQVLKWNPENIQSYCMHLLKPLKEYLKELGFKNESEKYSCNHIYSFSLPKNMNRKTLKDNLKKNNIILSERGEFLRISVNVYNDEKDISQFMETLKLSLSQSKQLIL